MDPDVLTAKLESLARCISRIEGRRPKPGAIPLERDIDAQDIIVLNLERAIQLCVDMGTHLLSASDAASPETMADVFREMAEERYLDAALAEAMARSVGFRNIAVHQYRAIDWEIVASILANGLDDFRAFARAILAATEKNDPA